MKKISPATFQASVRASVGVEAGDACLRKCTQIDVRKRQNGRREEIIMIKKKKKKKA